MGRKQYTVELWLMKCRLEQHKNKQQVSKTRYNVVD